MKKVLLAGILAITQAHAAVEFGGFNFHSTVTPDQVDYLKSDLSYLYQNQYKNSDAEFLKIAQLPAGDGANLHNFLINRVRFIVGQSYKLDNSSIGSAIKYRFPSTPFPVFPPAPVDGDTPPASKPGGKSEIQVVMTNLGGSIYLEGKKQSVLFGLKFDSQIVKMSSPRSGLLQVGKGLFNPGFMLVPASPKDPANAIFRLSTLFHEARHSDGNGLHTGFLHDYCPKGHPYAGFAACEVSGNGSYTIGALSGRHLLKNCSSCSPKQLASLQANVADSLNRIIPESTVKINSLRSLIKMYSDLLTRAQGTLKISDVAEINTRIGLLNQQIKNLKAMPVSNPPMFDPTPEGDYPRFSVDDSKKLMSKALGK